MLERTVALHAFATFQGNGITSIHDKLGLTRLDIEKFFAWVGMKGTKILNRVGCYSNLPEDVALAGKVNVHHLEVECIHTVRIALLGTCNRAGARCGSGIKNVLPILADSGIAYFPFAGFPKGYPIQLAGKPEEIVEHCQAFMAQGASGVDLLVYRADEADPLDHARAAHEGLGKGELIVAGSITAPEQMRRLHGLGIDAVTIGTTLFTEYYADARSGVVAQLAATLETMATLN